jgi:two-component system sensor histidine kinase AgrC
MISTYYLDGIIKTLVHFVIYDITMKRLYNIDYWKTIMLVLIYLIILMVIDAFAMSTLILILKITKSSFYLNYSGTLISNLISCTTIVIITIIAKDKIRKILNYNLDTNKRLVFLLVMTSICTFYCFFLAFSNVKIAKELYVNVGIIIVFLIVLFNLIKQLIVNNQKTMEYDKLLDFMKTYEEEIEKQRILRHETKNQLLTIKAKIYDKEKDQKVIKYIDSILNEKIEVSKEHYAKFHYLPANGLKALFYFKTQEAEKKGIKVSINVSKRIENSIIYNLNTNEFKQLGRLLGIYLDNAIEASEKSSDKILGIEIYLISENVEIIITNSYYKDNKVISNNGKSTKGKNRGHGLLLASSIISSSNLFKEERTTTDNLYIQKLTIKKSS